MADRLRVAVEFGPKGKKVVAVAPDWPGLTRGSTDEAGALEHLRAYIPRYAPVAALAGMGNEFAEISGIDVVERYTGTGSTDFWGISFGNSSFDLQAMSSAELERELALLRACWSFFDDVRSRVSAELRKGPRGGGRDRDQIVRHVLASELDWSKRVGVRTPLEELLTDDGLRMHRDDYCEAIRAFHAEGRQTRARTLRFVIRFTAYHTLDHAWEMEDKDLTAKDG